MLKLSKFSIRAIFLYSNSQFIIILYSIILEFMIYFGMWNNLKFEIKKFSENLIKFGIFYKIWDLGFEEGKFWFFFWYEN